MPDGYPAPSGCQQGIVAGGDMLAVLTRAAEITLGWELKKKIILISNYKLPVWKEHFVANLVPSKLLLFLRRKKKKQPPDLLISFFTSTAFP